jgi:hypothetical protein
MIDIAALSSAISQQKADNATRRAQYIELTDQETRRRRTERLTRLLACCTKQHVTHRLTYYGAVDSARVVLYSEYDMQPDNDNAYELDRLVDTPICALDIYHSSLPQRWQQSTQSVREVLEELLPCDYRLYAMYGRTIDQTDYWPRLYYQITVRTDNRCCNDPLCYICCQPWCETPSYLCLVDTLAHCCCWICLNGPCCTGNCLFTWWAGP